MLFMESVNRTLKNVLQFIAVLQETFEKNRMYIEKQDLIEFQNFIKECRQKQENISKEREENKKHTQKMELKHVKQQEFTDKNLVEEMEELALVNSLLQKARSIRMNGKELPKVIENSSTELPNSNYGSCLPQPHLKKEISITTGTCNKKILPRSKSAFSSTRIKTVVVPRSKSANVHLVPNEEKCLKNHKVTAKINSKKNVASFISKQKECIISKESDAVVVSNKELQEFKKSFAVHQYCDNRVQISIGCHKNSSSDFSQDSSSSVPTYPSFQDERKKRILHTEFQFHRGVLWYPFLGSKCRNYLLCHKKFTTVNSSVNAFTLIHKIQETIVWIDLLTLIGKDTLPNLILLDGNDLNAMRICSYLASLYQENLQRCPLLDPN